MGLLDWFNSPPAASGGLLGGPGAPAMTGGYGQGGPAMPSSMSGGLLGGGNDQISKLQIFAAMLQDLGANIDHRSPTALPGLMAKMETLGKQKQYQNTLAQQFAPGSTLQMPGAQGPGGVSIAPSNVDVAGGPMREALGARADAVLPFLQNADPSSGNSMMLKIAMDGMNGPEWDTTPRSGLNPATGKVGNYVTNKAGQVHWLDAGNAPDYNKPFNDDGTPNLKYQAYTQNNAKLGASNTNISVNTDKTYAGAMAGKLADQDAAVLDAARTAPQRFESAKNVLKILDDPNNAPITGTGANVRVGLDKALATAGIIDGKNVTSTENLASELASQTLDAIKSSGLGSGQGFTDKDRAFLEKAKSGNIELNAGTLHYLARKNMEAAQASIVAGNKVAARLKGNPDFGSVGQDLNTPVPAPYQPPAAQKPQGAPVRIMGNSDYARLPRCAQYIDPQGNLRTKK